MFIPDALPMIGGSLRIQIENLPCLAAAPRRATWKSVWENRRPL